MLSVQISVLFVLFITINMSETSSPKRALFATEQIETPTAKRINLQQSPEFLKEQITILKREIAVTKKQEVQTPDVIDKLSKLYKEVKTHQQRLRQINKTPTLREKKKYQQQLRQINETPQDGATTRKKKTTSRSQARKSQQVEERQDEDGMTVSRLLSFEETSKGGENAY